MRTFESKDIETAKDWMRRRGHNLPGNFSFPKTGLIEDGTACGFLIRTEMPTAMLDFFISNPLAERRVRLHALSQIAEALLNQARSEGIKGVICTTKYDNIRDIAIMQGFSYIGDFSTFNKEL